MQVNHSDIINACRVIFSPDIEITSDYLHSLKLSAVKSAFRNKAFETHPDRARILGINDAVLLQRFQEISRAYDLLSSFVENSARSGRIYPSTGSFNEAYESWTKRTSSSKKFYSDKKTRRTTGFNRTFYNTRQMPPEPLLFGQFLFHAGVINMKTLLDALFWQRNQRPAYGEIALDWKIVERSDLVKILKNKKPGERFGECALRLGMVNSFQNMAILAKQANSQKKIGEFFKENRVLHRAIIDEMILLNKKHNSRFRN